MTIEIPTWFVIVYTGYLLIDAVFSLEKIRLMRRGKSRKK